MGHDSIPAHQVMPSILSLNLNELKEVISYLESDESFREALINIRSGALKCAKTVIDEIKDLSEVKEKLNIIGVAL